MSWISVHTKRIALIVLATCVIVSVSCRAPERKPRREETDTKSAFWPKTTGQPLYREAKFAALKVQLPTIEGAEYVEDDSFCMQCHETYVQTFRHNVHQGHSCEKCHGPASRHMQTRGKEPNTILSFRTMTPPQRAEVCLQCHETNQCEPGALWRTSVHAHNGVSCTDCHTSHYNVPPGTPPTTLASDATGSSEHQLASHVQEEQDQLPVDQAKLTVESRHMGAIAPQVCYRCHGQMERYEHIAHPHQILGPNGFTCATCHDPHGKVRHETRTDLCLKCHTDAPTMAWHSSSHSLNGVACTDCHNPHPRTDTPSIVNINHTSIQRPGRLPMSVDEPNACYKCHPAIYAQNAMPSHHPIKEGKMTCSSCHDGHGQSHGNLLQPTTNMVCYRCHAEKQGPFVYEHPPVTENCAICHDPHGTVTNNLLRQPTTFLCLRCHTGHRTGPNFGPHTGAGLVDVGNNANLQQAFYTDCTQCHSQVHGSDLPSPHLPKAFVR
jgi:DmsE family decaheme c-type cytochrome